VTADRRLAAHDALLLSLGLAVAGCASNPSMDFGWFDGTNGRRASGFAVQWTRGLTPDGTAYVPVEQAAPAVDAVRGVVYAGSIRGKLLALDVVYGTPIYAYDAKAAIEAPPAVDAERGELYVATVRGTLVALRAHDGSERWRADVSAAVSQAPLLRSDALYVVTDDDTVLALARKDGSLLWRYKREPPEGLAIAGHAGLTAIEGKVLTGFGDGAVVALDASDGRTLWESDTSTDLQDLDATRRFVDVDATPAVVEGVVYTASFSGGLYGFEIANGTVRVHEPSLKGVTAVTAGEDVLLVSSADRGLLCLSLPALTVRWQRAVERGAPGKAELRGSTVYVAESLGGLLAVALENGRELGRLETAHGITAPATLSDRRGFAVSNTGTLYAFTL
jgi:outer membrane protein assembly factor BamB